MNSNQTNRFIRGYRIFRVALHIVRGLLTAALFFPLVDKPRRSVAIRRWSARLVKLLNVRVTVRGHSKLPGSRRDVSCQPCFLVGRLSD